MVSTAKSELFRRISSIIPKVKIKKISNLRGHFVIINKDLELLDLDIEEMVIHPIKPKILPMEKEGI